MTAPAFDPFRDPELDAAVASQGPLPADIALRLIARGRAKLEAGEPALSLPDFQRVIGHDDPSITGEGLLGIGDAVYRLDDEAQAKDAWEAATQLRDNAATYRAWRNLGGARVREGDLVRGPETIVPLLPEQMPAGYWKPLALHFQRALVVVGVAGQRLQHRLAPGHMRRAHRPPLPQQPPRRRRGHPVGRSALM